MKTLFIHIPKNAGRTIQRSDEIKKKIVVNKSEFIKPDHLRKMKVIMEKYGEHVGSGMQHARWRYIILSITSTHPAFAIVRNPWSKVVSRYTYNQRVIQRKNTNPSYKNMSFDEFLEERHKWGNIPYFWHRAIRNWYQQKEHVVNDHGTIKCDIIRMECFDEDIVKYLNLKKVPEKRNVSNGKIVNNRILQRKDYKDFYTEKTIQIMADWYKEDIETFGFDFDTPATKNIWEKL